MAINDSYKHEIYRKSIHLSSLWIVFLIWFFDKNISITILGTLTFLILATEILRHKIDFIAIIYNKIFGSILRDHEKEAHNKFSLSGGFYVLAAALISVIIFPQIIAIAAITIMLISDTAAALIGRKFGKHKLMTKSVEGSLAFFLSAIIVIYVLYRLTGYDINFLISGIIASVFATLIELFAKQIKIDDNITITLTVGAIMTAYVHFLPI